MVTAPAFPRHPGGALRRTRFSVGAAAAARQLARLLLLALCASAGLCAAQSTVETQLRAGVEALRGVVPGVLLADGQSLADGVARFYQQRGFTPAWADAQRRAQLLAALEDTAADGLNPRDYHVEALRQWPAAGAAPERRAALDLLATQGYLLALSHLFRGKVDPAALDPHWSFPRNDISTGRALPVVAAAVADGDIAGVFQRARPAHPLYRRLRTALAQLRTLAATGGWEALPAGPTLDPGTADPRVPLLRRRLLAAGDLPAGAAADVGVLYDAPLVEGVKTFQREQYLQVDGRIGAATLAALNVPVQTRIDQLRVNLERARWLLHDLPERFVMVDIAGFGVTYFRGSNPVWQSRVQVGRPYRRTPTLRSTIRYITFNPRWVVPPTILRKDVLPAVRKNPAYLERNHLRVFDAEGNPVDAAGVDWTRPGNLVLRQDAGPHSALGRAAIRFPNAFSVYLHDTPHQELFGRAQRAFSSGCIRVEHALQLVELLLDDPQRWNRAAIDREIATGVTKNVDLARPVPILLMYWTVSVSPEGHLAFKPDIYQRDAAVLQALDAAAR